MRTWIPVWSAVFLAVMITLASRGFSQTVGGARKVNLDLPYNAVGESEEEEDAPEIISMYGQLYEASSIVFCLDESLTMNRGNRLEIEKREAKQAISELSDEAEFGVIFYGGKVTSFRSQLSSGSAENKRAASVFVDSRKTNLGTCLGDAVERALRMLNRSATKHRAVILISDGTPTRCPFVPQQNCEGRRQVVSDILQQIRGANTQRIPIHTIFVAEDDRCGLAQKFMWEVAQTSGGTARTVRQ